MIGKHFVPHRFAVQDEEEIIRYYEQTSSEQIALSFINALDQAFSQLSRYPHMGSPRPEYDLNLDGIRSWSLKRFPHLIYYILVSSMGLLHMSLAWDSLQIFAPVLGMGVACPLFSIYLVNLISVVQRQIDSRGARYIVQCTLYVAQCGT